MARFLQTVLVVVLVSACTAEPQRFRNVRTNRFFARQEVAVESAPPVPAPAPYPPAGIKPEVSFELPTEATTVQPDNTYLPPDNTYGPPEAPVDPEVGTEVPEIVLVDDDDTDSVLSVAVSYDQDNLITPDEPQRLVFGQRTRTRPSQRLRAIRAEPIFFDDGSFAYSRQL